MKYKHLIIAISVMIYGAISYAEFDNQKATSKDFSRLCDSESTGHHLTYLSCLTHNKTFNKECVKKNEKSCQHFIGQIKEYKQYHPTAIISCRNHVMQNRARSKDINTILTHFSKCLNTMKNKKFDKKLLSLINPYLIGFDTLVEIADKELDKELLKQCGNDRPCLKTVSGLKFPPDFASHEFLNTCIAMRGRDKGVCLYNVVKHDSFRKKMDILEHKLEQCQNESPRINGSSRYFKDHTEGIELLLIPKETGSGVLEI